MMMNVDDDDDDDNTNKLTTTHLRDWNSLYNDLIMFWESGLDHRCIHLGLVYSYNSPERLEQPVQWFDHVLRIWTGPQMHSPGAGL